MLNYFNKEMWKSLLCWGGATGQAAGKEHPEAPVEAEGQAHGGGGEARRLQPSRDKGRPGLRRPSTAAMWREPLRAEWNGRRSSPVCWLQQRQRITSAGEGGAGEMGSWSLTWETVQHLLKVSDGVTMGTNNNTPRGKPVRNETYTHTKPLHMTLFI